MPGWAINQTQGFGPTDEPLDGPYDGYAHFNKGYDFGLSPNTPIDSHIRGTVVGVSNDPQNSTGWGKYVWIQDAAGNIHRFNHLNSTGKWKVGDNIGVGDIVGLSGNTGKSTGPHLSYDVTDANGRFIDPGKFLGKQVMADVNGEDNGVTGGYKGPDIFGPGGLLDQALTGKTSNPFLLGNGSVGSSRSQDPMKQLGARFDYLMGQAAQYKSQGKQVPQGLLDQIRDINLLVQMGQGVLEDPSKKDAEDRYAQRLSLMANLLGAGVSMGSMKAQAAAQKLSAYNDQYARGLVSPTGYKLDQTPGSFMRSQVGLTDQNDSAYQTRKEAVPDVGDITSAADTGWQQALDRVIGMAGPGPSASRAPANDWLDPMADPSIPGNHNPGAAGWPNNPFDRLKKPNPDPLAPLFKIFGARNKPFSWLTDPSASYQQDDSGGGAGSNWLQSLMSALGTNTRQWAPAITRPGFMRFW